HATFESRAPESFDQCLEGHVPELCLVAVGGGTPLGWAALGLASDRSVYAGVAEESVYVAPSHFRRGVGRSLLAALISQSEEHGYWTLQAGIFPENAASIALHRAPGLRSARAAPLHRPHGLRADGRTVARCAVPGAAQPADRH
ncbi:MAG TPA: GNAT family N-acetyltransferase, partial [Steroidobacteraceae bacterium]|nr:GNAT family N-acetyltransferase [Steroidobacteraceae bacterium]